MNKYDQILVDKFRVIFYQAFSAAAASILRLNLSIKVSHLVKKKI